VHRRLLSLQGSAFITPRRRSRASPTCERDRPGLVCPFHSGAGWTLTKHACFATAEYMTLPASQYSVLDAKRIERIDDDTFRSAARHALLSGCGDVQHEVSTKCRVWGRVKMWAIHEHIHVMVVGAHHLQRAWDMGPWPSSRCCLCVDKVDQT